MKIIRFIVSAAFAWMLIRATFANTVSLRHHQTSSSTHASKASPPAVAADRLGLHVRT